MMSRSNLGGDLFVKTLISFMSSNIRAFRWGKKKSVVGIQLVERSLCSAILWAILAPEATVVVHSHVSVTCLFLFIYFLQKIMERL